MRFYDIKSYSHSADSVVFRNKKLSAVFGGIIVLSFMALLIICWHRGKTPPFASFVIWTTELFLLLCLGLSVKLLRQATLPTNWLMAIARDGLYLKYRSYLNDKLPAEDMQIVRLEYDEILSCCTVVRQETVLSLNKSRRTKIIGTLELSAPAACIEQLQQALHQERNTHKHKNRRAGAVFSDYPITIHNQAVRIIFNNIRPSIYAAAEMLRQKGVAVLEGRNEKTDLSRKAADTDDVDKDILSMAQRGDTIAAISVIRQTYDTDIAEAKKYLEDLMADNV